MQLVQLRPDLAKFVSLGDEVIIVADDKLAVQIGSEGKAELSEEDVKLLKVSSPTNVSQHDEQDSDPNSLLIAATVLAVALLIAITKFANMRA